MESVKKYGIITHYDVHNHGALLQLYALEQVLQGLGIDAIALQYDKNYDFLGHDMKSKYEISIKSIGIYLKFLRERGVADFVFNYKKRKVLNAFKQKYGLIGKYYTEYDHLDGIIIGSDEVFALHTGPTPVLFGHGLPSEKVFAYGGSFGPTTIADIDSTHCRPFVSSGLNSLCGLGMRDQNSVKIAKELTGREPELVCDPVILYGYEKEFLNSDRPMVEPYLVVYSYDNRFDDSATEVISFAKKRGLKIVSPGFYQKWADINVNVTPIGLLAWFKYADCVVTNPFHGCVLSILSGREMAIKIRDNSNKLLNLAQEYRIDDRLFDNVTSLETVFDNKIDWTTVNNQIISRRDSSMSYLVRMVE